MGRHVKSDMENMNIMKPYRHLEYESRRRLLYMCTDIVSLKKNKTK